MNTYINTASSWIMVCDVQTSHESRNGENKTITPSRIIYKFKIFSHVKFESLNKLLNSESITSQMPGSKKPDKRMDDSSTHTHTTHTHTHTHTHPA